VLAGRQPERAVIRALLDDVRASRGSSLVLRGLPGVGKSTLIADTEAAADDFLVLRTSGIESESPMAFAALQRLLRPVLHLVDRLPAVQAAALRAAFGGEGDADRFVVFLGALSLLAEAAEDSPVLAVVDDAHWLDEGSAAALLFVARRLRADRVAVLFAAREGDVLRFESGDLPNLVLRDLETSDAAAVIGDRAGVPVPADVLGRLVDETGGNPLALVELAGALTADQLEGRAALPARLPLTEGVESAYIDRYRRLPEAAQGFLLVAAADDTGRMTIVGRAARAVSGDPGAADLAEESGLVTVVEGQVVFRHPLVRSAIYGAATSRQRRGAHRALAEVMVELDDADRRAWHRAAAAEEPDETVVAELDAVAMRASARGGKEAASSAWERAAELTVDNEQRAVRLLAAAGASWLAAHPGRAKALAEAARVYAVSPVLSADIDRLRARIEWNIGSAAVGHRMLLRAAEEVAVIDPGRAREMAMMAAAAASFGADSGTDIDPVRFAVATDGLASPVVSCSTQLLVGFADVGRGRLADAVEPFRRALAECGSTEDVDLLSNLGLAAMYLGDHAHVLSEFGRLATHGRESGAPVLVLYALTRRALAEVAVGDWTAAAADSVEALELARGTGQAALAGLPLAWLALLAALRGDDVASRARLEELTVPERAQEAGLTGVVVRDVVSWAKGVNAAGSPDTALQHLDAVSHVVVRHMSSLDRMEAAVRAGQPDRAALWADEIRTFAEVTGAKWGAAAAAYGRALTLEGSDASAHYELALELYGLSDHRADRARVELSFGEHLRRVRRRVDARPHLRQALDTFDDLGASPWAERAHQELRASGETARKRDVSTSAALTPQELQVANLVRRGLSNRDVAAQLFLSPRTIDFHLRNVFTKLGLSSRSELAALDMP